MGVFRQIVRGCGTLPHVGEHPGTLPVIALTIVTGLAGAQRNGVLGFAVGCSVAAFVYGPMFLYGAYSRAKVSDAIERHEKRVRG